MKIFTENAQLSYVMAVRMCLKPKCYVRTDKICLWICQESLAYNGRIIPDVATLFNARDKGIRLNLQDKFCREKNYSTTY